MYYIFAIFVDFRKAFNSVDWDLQWHVFGHFGVPTKNLHMNMERCVAYGGELSSKFPIHSVVRQGSVEGPVLFILFLAAIIEVALPCRGFQVS